MEIRGDLVGVWREIKVRVGKVYVYSITHDGVPFYIGVGTGRRILLHERPPAINKANAKAVRLREILASGGALGYAIHGWFDEWAEAAEEERRLIALYGRADLGLGGLTNRTNGGQGTGGIAWHSSPNRMNGARKAAEKNRGRKATDEHKAKIGAAHKGRVWRPETLAKRSVALKGRPLSPEHCAKMSDARKGWKPSPEVLAAGVKWRADNATALSEARKKRWNDPAYREKMSKALKGVKRDTKYAAANRERQRKKFEEPEFRAKWDAARRAGVARRKESRAQQRD